MSADRLTSTFGHAATALEVVDGHDLRGRYAIVTGGYAGIGLETSRALLAAGATVTLAVRDAERGETVAEALRADTQRDTVDVLDLDLADLASIRRFADTWRSQRDRLHILVNNAGIMATPLARTPQGWESQLATNHIGHYALTSRLLDPLRRAEGARLVQLSSIGHRLSPVDLDDPHFEQREYDKWRAYGQSKTANALFVRGMHHRFAGEGIDAFAVHPGGIMTDLQRHLPDEELSAMGWDDPDRRDEMGFKSPEQGAATSVWAATSPDLAERGGRYLEDCAEAQPATPGDRSRGVAPHATDDEAADRLWAATRTMLADV